MVVLLALLAALAIGTLVFSAFLLKVVLRFRIFPSLEGMAVSFVANFFDTLGIGSFAPTTAYLVSRKLVPDALIPPTLIVGYAIPVAVEALLFITSVQVDPFLLAGCILMSIIGAWLGAAIAASLPGYQIRLTMGTGLLLAGAIFALSNLGLMPVGGTATSLGAAWFVVALLVNLGLGILMNLGIGNYGPSLIILSLLGLDPRAAFPIMMGASAFLMLTGGVKIVTSRVLNPRLLLGMALGGIPGVLFAAFIIRSLPLQTLRWGVVAVVTYTGIVMLATNDAHRETVHRGKPHRSS